MAFVNRYLDLRYVIQQEQSILFLMNKLYYIFIIIDCHIKKSNKKKDTTDEMNLLLG